MKNVAIVSVFTVMLITLLALGCAAQASPTAAPTATKSPAAPPATATKPPAAPAANTAPAQATPTKTAAQTYAEVMAGWKAPAGKTVKVGYGGKIAFNWVASAVALELLKEKGFKIEIIEFSGATAVIQGMATGEADLGVMSISGGLTAIEKGADLRALFEGYGMTWRVVAKKDVTDFKQLAGKPIADSTTGQLTDFLLTKSTKKYAT